MVTSSAEMTAEELAGTWWIDEVTDARVRMVRLDLAVGRYARKPRHFDTPEGVFIHATIHYLSKRQAPFLGHWSLANFHEAVGRRLWRRARPEEYRRYALKGTP